MTEQWLRGSLRRAGRALSARAVWGLASAMLCSPDFSALGQAGGVVPVGGGSSSLLQGGVRTAFQRGLLALRENHLEVALAEFSAAERERPTDGLVRNFRGIVLAQMGRSAEAREEYRSAIRDDPKLEAAYRNLGFLEWNGHQLEAAQRELEAALKLVPDDRTATYYLGRVELESGRYAEAFRELERSGMPLPKDPDVQLPAAHGLVALGRQEEAAELLDRLAPRTLSDAQTAQLAALLIAVHEGGASARLLERWREGGRERGRRDHAVGEEGWAGADLMLAYLLEGEYERAADAAGVCGAGAGEAATAAADHERPRRRLADACSVLGIADAHLGKGDLAIEGFRRAAELAPEKEEVWLNLTREQMELSRFAEAIATSEEAVRAHPESYALQLRMGAAYLAVDRYKEAEGVFRRLILAGDPLPTSAVGLAQVLLRSGRASDAVRELAETRRRVEASFLLCYFQGLAYSRAGQTSEAAAAFHEALQFNPDSAEAHGELGKTELKQGHIDVSIAEFERALALDPADVQARRMLQQASHRAGKTAEKVVEVPLAPPVSDLVGDFIVPEWELPGK